MVLSDVSSGKRWPKSLGKRSQAASAFHGLTAPLAACAPKSVNELCFAQLLFELTRTDRFLDLRPLSMVRHCRLLCRWH